MGQIDLTSLASRHILKTLSKSKPISSSLLFPRSLLMQKEFEGKLGEREMAKRNLIARLYNSNSVKEEIVVVLEGVRKAMGVGEGETEIGKKEPGSKKWQPQERDGSGVGDDDDEERDQRIAEDFRALKVKAGTAQDSVEAGEIFEEEWDGITDLRASEDSEIDLDTFTASFNNRLAGSSDEEDLGLPQRDINDAWSGGEEADEDDYKETPNLPAAEIVPEQKLKSKSKSKAKSKTRQDNISIILKSKRSEPPSSSKMSTFLPTLMSGYISGSDSDINTDYYKNKNSKKNGPAEPKDRKNRMGQQARRALWEKKFGKNADHVKREEAEQGRKEIERRIKRGKGAGGKKGDGVKKKEKSTEVKGPLHPSWEAARKTKEQQSKVQEAVMGKPMGTKIVFD